MPFALRKFNLGKSWNMGKWKLKIDSMFVLRCLSKVTWPGTFKKLFLIYKIMCIYEPGCHVLFLCTCHTTVTPSQVNYFHYRTLVNLYPLLSGKDIFLKVDRRYCFPSSGCGVVRTVWKGGCISFPLLL